MTTEGDLLHTVTADTVSESRKRLGKLMVWGTAMLCAGLALWQFAYETGRVEAGFANWRPVLYAYILWATALCAAQVIAHGEKGKRSLFVLPAALFVISSPSVWAAAVWLVGFGVARLGYTYAYLSARTGLRGPARAAL